MQFFKGDFSFRLKSKFDVGERGFNETQVLERTEVRELFAIH